MKFVVDGMLGKLTRWLRMMGHDVMYSTCVEDAELLAIAKEENRVLLTRDLELYQRAVGRGIEAYYVEGATEAERLAELARRFGVALSIDLEKSRCPRCNAKLNHVAKEEIAGAVEANTLKYYDVFWKCPGCGHVYWQGAHWMKIRTTLKEAEAAVARSRP
ncbi:MAG: Mut7-C RNAse domain-containing protein [Candidatus Bathyarchaeia archaeon]